MMQRIENEKILIQISATKFTLILANIIAKYNFDVIPKKALIKYYIQLDNSNVFFNTCC